MKFWKCGTIRFWLTDKTNFDLKDEVLQLIGIVGPISLSRSLAHHSDRELALAFGADERLIFALIPAFILLGSMIAAGVMGGSTNGARQVITKIWIVSSFAALASIFLLKYRGVGNPITVGVAGTITCFLSATLLILYIEGRNRRMPPFLWSTMLILGCSGLYAITIS